MRAQEHYQALIESSDDGIVAKDLAGNIVSWNPAAEKLFGYSAEEMIGSSIRRLIPDERQHEEDEILARIAAGKKIEPFLTERIRKDGRRIHVFASISPVRGSDGTIIGASKIVRDATERIEADLRLNASEQRFRMLAENMSQLAWIAEPDGPIHWYNRRWYDYTGETPETMDGWGWQNVHHPEHVDRVTEGWKAAIAAGEAWEDTFPLRSADGDWRWFLSRAKPIRDADDNISHWFGTNTDITEQREQAEQIRLLLMEVNHRAKNMLAKIQALARQTADGDAEFVQRFQLRVGSMACNQDMLIARDWRGVPTEELVRAQLAFAGEGQERFSISGDACALTPRASEVIGMALHELATNALRYGALSTDSGHVAISWHCSEEGRFEISWRETGGPPVAEPLHTGFGTSIIRDIPRSALGAKVTLDYRPEGLCWTLSGERLNPDPLTLDA